MWYPKPEIAILSVEPFFFCQRLSCDTREPAIGANSDPSSAELAILRHAEADLRDERRPINESFRIRKLFVKEEKSI